MIKGMFYVDGGIESDFSQHIYLRFLNKFILFINLFFVNSKINFIKHSF